MTRSNFVKSLIGGAAAAALSIGIGVVGAGPADAGGTVWDKVASCESGGNWKINTGNGFTGGLQFSNSTWRGYGGRAYASSAYKASKAEQIAIARRTLAGQGPGAWPTCGRRAGLTKSNGKASPTATPATNPGATKSAAKKPVPSKKKYTSVKIHKAPTVGKTIRVKRGDTLSKIAKRYHVKGGWKGLWKLNKHTLRNPNNIYIGQVLVIRK